MIFEILATNCQLPIINAGHHFSNLVDLNGGPLLAQVAPMLPHEKFIVPTKITHDVSFFGARRIQPALLCVLLLQMLAACGADADFQEVEESEELDDIQSEIIGGGVTAAHPAVVSLSGAGDCTGTLVSSRVVLTAAHCVNDRDIAGLAPGGFGPKDSSFVGSAPFGTSYRHPGYEVVNGVPVNDIGVVVLWIPITNVRPLKIGAFVKGAYSRKIGYGLNDRGQGYERFGYDGLGLKVDGKKRRVAVTPQYFDGAPWVNRPQAFLKMGSSGCFGDSGGPTLQYYSKEWRIVGVSSFIDPATATSPICRGATYDSVAQRGASWVQSMIDSSELSIASTLSARAVSSKQINLTWGANSESDLAGYKIYRNGHAVASVQRNVTRYSDTGLTPATTYFYSVNAFYRDGSEARLISQVKATTSVR